MKKLYEALRTANVEGDVGIEIECEGKNLQIMDSQYWKTEDDGSLRGMFPHSRAEFILKKPIPANKVSLALRQLNAAQREAEFNFSFRTSVHVHVNCLDLDKDGLLNFMYTYLLLEEPLVAYCGEVRVGNRFCLRLSDAEGVLDYIKYIAQHGFNGIGKFREDQVRYAAMNLGSLAKYGSLEFRSMRGTNDPAILEPWIGALIALREYAKSKKNVKEVHKEFTDNGPVAFFYKVLGELAEHFNNPDLPNQLLRNYSLSYEIPAFYKDEVEKKEVEKNPKNAFGIPPGVGMWPGAEIYVDDIGRMMARQQAAYEEIIRAREENRRLDIQFEDDME